MRVRVTFDLDEETLEAIRFQDRSRGRGSASRKEVVNMIQAVVAAHWEDLIQDMTHTIDLEAEDVDDDSGEDY